MKDGRLKPKRQGGQTGRTLLERWIVKQRMTQAEAAELIGISRVKLNQYLNIGDRPSLETAVRIEDVTGIGVRLWLLDDPPDARRIPPAGEGGSGLALANEPVKAG
jgi:transcriptional regulator with XRE-family HTH domain